MADITTLLTTAEIVVKTGVSRQRIAELVRTGRLPVIRRGRSWFFHEPTLAKDPLGWYSLAVHRERVRASAEGSQQELELEVEGARN